MSIQTCLILLVLKQNWQSSIDIALFSNSRDGQLSNSTSKVVVKRSNRGRFRNLLHFKDHGFGYISSVFMLISGSANVYAPSHECHN